MLDLESLKKKLELLESKITVSAAEAEKREKIFAQVNETYENDYLKKQDNRINFNVNGKTFTTTEHSINQHNNTLFNELIKSDNKLKNRDSIYIDRDPDLFSYVLDFIRYKKLNLDKNNKKLNYLIRNEAEFFEVYELAETIDNLNSDVDVINFNFTGAYLLKGLEIGTNKLEHIKDENRNDTGICCKSPATIVFELNRPCEISSLNLRPFHFDIYDSWNYVNGLGSKIFFSVDGNKWEEVGKVDVFNKGVVNNIKVTV